MGGAAHAIGQYIHRDTSLSLRTLTNKVSANDVNVSHMTISRYLKEHGYQKSIPQATPMLITKHKENMLNEQLII